MGRGRDGKYIFTCRLTDWHSDTPGIPINNITVRVLSSSWDRRPFGHNRHRPKIGGLCRFGVREVVPHATQCGQGRGLPLYQVSSNWSIQPFGHNRHGPIIGGEGCAPLEEGELRPHLTKCGLGRGLPPCQVTSWSIQPFRHSRHEPKIGGCALLGRSWVPV